MARLRARHAKAGYASEAQLTRRSTVLRRWREASRRCSGIVLGTVQLQAARHRACASQARVLRLLPIDSDRSGALAYAPRESRLCLGGRSWHVAARSCADGERRLAGSVTFKAYGLTTTSVSWRARVARMRAAPPPNRQRAQWRARVRATRMLAVPRRPQLARRTTVLHQRRKASR